MPLRPARIHPITQSFIRGYYPGPDGMIHMPPAQAMNQIVIHHLPINGTVNCRSYRQFWTISQFLRTRGVLHPIVPNFVMADDYQNKRTAANLAREIAQVFHDDKVEWQDSFQLPYLSAVMREYDPHIWGRWGERWEYTREYAQRVFIPMNCGQPLPSYVIADRYKDGDHHWNGWGKFNSKWGLAVLALEEPAGPIEPADNAIVKYRRIG